jgi:hypothetical protein
LGAEVAVNHERMGRGKWRFGGHAGTHVHMYVYIHMHVHAYACMYGVGWGAEDTHAYAFVCDTYMRMRVCMYIRAHAFTYVNAWICVYV